MSGFLEMMEKRFSDFGEMIEKRVSDDSMKSKHSEDFLAGC